MTWPTQTIAGLRTLVLTPGNAPAPAVVMLHGYAMLPEDLAPFVASLGVPGAFYLPEAPLDAEPHGRAWWPIDQERRARQMARGPRDLWEEHPAGAVEARALLGHLLGEVHQRHPRDPIALVGFSQGAMLACDWLLRQGVDVAALALLSSSRISADDWGPLAGRLADLPVLVTHGTEDPDLSFHAGERLRDFVTTGGASTTWVPFDGGHEIPLVAWRALRKLLQRLEP